MADLGPSFGGITRIRFKGSHSTFLAKLLDSQPSGSPALISDFEITTHVPEVKDISHDGHEGHEGTQSSNDVVTLVDFV